MKDTTITAAMKKRELIIILACFLAAYTLNVIGIIKHQTPIRELITQFHVVLLIALVFYVMILFLRILYYLVSRLWIRRK